jgi:glycosyltransferase involved in cell wall biosynthesis
MQETVKGLLAIGDFDAVLAFHPALLGPAATVRGLPVVADFVDEPVLGALRQLRAAGGVLGFARLARFVASAVRYERAHCRHVSCCVVVSDADARCLRRIVPATPVHVVPKGIDFDYFKPSGIAIQPYSLVFTDLRARDGENVRITDHPKQFAARVLEFLHDPLAAAELGRAGRLTVLEHYGWAAQASHLEDILWEPIERQRGA